MFDSFNSMQKTLEDSHRTYMRERAEQERKAEAERRQQEEERRRREEAEARRQAALEAERIYRLNKGY